jgi:hypothetical protein
MNNIHDNFSQQNDMIVKQLISYGIHFFQGVFLLCVILHNVVVPDIVKNG